MAGRDKTGPLGAGPGTGRGLGGCVPGTFVRGRGRGCGLGFDNSLLNRIALLEEKIDALLGAKKED